MNQPKLPADLPAPLKALYFEATSKIFHIEQGGDLPEDLVRDVRELIDGGHYDEAQAALSASASWRTTYMGHLLLGNSLMGQERFADAELEFRTAESIEESAKSPSDQRVSVTRSNRALSHLMRENYKAAVELCDAAIERFAPWPGPWVNKLAALHLSGNVKDFASVFAEMDRLWPDWRSDELFADRLKRDAHLSGARFHLASLIQR